MAASAVLMGTGNGHIRVSEATAQAIRDAADELGYRPNLAAQQLAGKRSGVVALVVRDVRNFLTQKVLAELHHEAEENGLRLLTVGSYPGLEALERVLQDAEAGWVDGVIYLAHENESQWQRLKSFAMEGVRVVSILGDLESSGIVRVASDVHPGAMASVEHLVTSGRRRIVLLTEQTESPEIRQRIQSYTEAMQSHGLEFGSKQIVVATKGWFLSDPATYPLFDDLARRIVSDMKAEAVLCDSDFTAAGLTRAVRRLGMACPADVAIIGWGDLQFAALFDPPLTTVANDLPALVKQSLAIIQADQHDLTTRISIPTSLLIRETT